MDGFSLSVTFSPPPPPSMGSNSLKCRQTKGPKDSSVPQSLSRLQYSPYPQANDPISPP